MNVAIRFFTWSVWGGFTQILLSCNDKESSLPDLTIVSVSVGRDVSCLLDSAGGVTCWGTEEYWNGNAGSAVVDNVPNVEFEKMTMGSDFACGIDVESNLACWGEPPDLFGTSQTQYVDVDASYNRLCAVSEQGLISCWSKNDTYPKSMEMGVGIVEVVAGEGVVCGRSMDASVTCWSDEDTTIPDIGFEYASSLSISFGGTVCGVLSDSTIKCQGGEQYDQISSAPVGDFLQIDSFGYFFCALDTIGSIHCWGQLPPSDDVTNWGAMHNAPGGLFTEISTGFQHSCALSGEDGFVQCWGAVSNDILDVPDPY